MSELIRDSSLCQAFACYQMDTPAHSSFFPVEPHSHYFSEVMLMRSGVCRVVRDRGTGRTDTVCARPMG